MYQRILVPTDGSPTALKALTSAIALAKEFGAKIRVLHVLEQLTYFVYDPYGGYTNELLQAVRASGDKLAQDAVDQVKTAGLEADSQILDEIGEPLGEAVVRAAKDWHADLIVLGTHGRRGVSRMLMGSGAEQVIRMAPVPVLVIRADERGTAGTAQ